MCDSATRVGSSFFFSSVPLLRWCCVDDTLPENKVAGLAFLQVDWIQMLADCTSAVIPLSQVVREWAPSSSSPMKVSK